MRKQGYSTPARAARPPVQQHIDGQLHESFKISNRMEPYAKRLRLRTVHLDLSEPKKAQRLASGRRKMAKILVKKKIRPDAAQRAVAQTLDIAADHLLEGLRRDQSFGDLKRSQKHLERLSKQLGYVRLAFSKLPPLAKGKLNKIVAEQDWQNFDTETFIKLIHAMADALANLSPACTANEARRAINELARGSKQSSVAQIVRTAPPVILELWEAIPGGARTHAEAGLRNWLPTPRQPAIAFLNRLSTLLENFRPRLKRGRRSPIERRFGQRIARIWRGLGLHVGRAYNGEYGRHIDSSFQRFARLALAAIGDDSRLSNRQIMNLKSEHCAKNCDRQVKSFKQRHS